MPYLATSRHREYENHYFVVYPKDTPHASRRTTYYALLKRVLLPPPLHGAPQRPVARLHALPPQALALDLHLGEAPQGLVGGLLLLLAPVGLGLLAREAARRAVAGVEEEQGRYHGDDGEG